MLHSLFSYLPSDSIDWFIGGGEHAAQRAVTLLSEHLSDDGPRISELVLPTFLESCACYMISRWSNEDGPEHSQLPILLVRLFVTSWEKAPDVAWAIVSEVLMDTDEKKDEK